MPSSTSSSDIPYRHIPERNWGLAWLISAALVVAALTSWELKARSMQHLPGDYDGYTNFTTQWAEERRKLDEPDHPLNKAFDGKGFLLKDEIYQMKSPPYRRTISTATLKYSGGGVTKPPTP